MDALARGLPSGPPHRVWYPNVRGGMWFRYQRGKMLSEVEYVHTLMYGSFLGADAATFWPIPHDVKIYLTAIDWAFYIGSAATWVMTLRRSLFDESSYPDIISRSTSGLTALRWYGFTDEINLEVDGTGPNSGTNTQGIMYNIDEQTGSANLYPEASVRYRLVAP